MSERFGADLSLTGRLWIWVIWMLGMTLLMGACTKNRSPSDTEPQNFSSVQDSLPSSDVSSSLGPETFSLVYIDASEAENRRILQQWVKRIKETQEASSSPWMVFFSHLNEPVVSTDSESFPLIRRALVRQFPPIPKPVEEADRVWKHLDSISSQWQDKNLAFHCFFSPSFHDISIDVFFNRLLEELGPFASRIELTIYTEGPVPDNKHFVHSALKSVSYIQLSNDHLL